MGKRLKISHSWLKKGAFSFGLEISDECLEKFQTYSDLLLEWNRKHNLTGLRTEEEIFVKHFLDSLFGFLGFSPEGADLVLDLGSGAGFPGIPLKIVKPEFSLVLLEPRLHASRFLGEILTRLEVSAKILCQRAETAGRGELRERCHFVVSRAVAPLNQLVELALPLLEPGGRLVSWKGDEINDEMENARYALEELGGEIEKVVPYRLPYWNLNRNLLVVRKIKKTPEKYPRKPGMPAKRPLASSKR